MSKESIPSHITQNMDIGTYGVKELTGESVETVYEFVAFLMSRDDYRAGFEETLGAVVLALSNEHTLSPTEQIAAVLGVPEPCLSNAIRQYRRVLR